ncbi:hypothetical protein HAP47_0000365 [Bradyrhizobium sp. 41S5]|uniref:hypothetical protein n=1 Tax=Bradyrhizobium sp. 41S5 TaxID=1404443 RepID=UPI00156ADA82|nr:hypothetical protein [Bradyrhizobium sp. 41S5]UFX45231.1 hypothetical protein HAP47_0000365 [Bradyrhizobium sp. 41S5]
MATDLVIFDRYGKIDHEAIVKADLEALSPDVRAALARVIETSALVENAENRVVQARKRMAELSAAHDAAHNALIAIRGPVDPVAEAKRVIALHNGVVQREPTISELAKTHAEMQAAARASDAKIRKGSTDEEAAAHNELMGALKAAREKLERAQKIEAATVAL